MASKMYYTGYCYCNYYYYCLLLSSLVHTKKKKKEEIQCEIMPLKAVFFPLGERQEFLTTSLLSRLNL